MHHRWPRNSKTVIFTGVTLLLLFILACGSAATPTPRPTNTPAPVATEVPAATTGPAATSAPRPTNTPIPTVQPTPRPTAAVVARDDITIVINEEPSIPDPWLGTTLTPNQVYHNVVQPISFLAPDFVDTATGGFESFEIIDPSRWRLHLMPGVKFHNGEEWNAEAAKWNIDILGSNVEFNPYSNVRGSHAEIIDDLTVDFVCDEKACPLLPRYAQFHVFVAPGYYQDNSQEDRDEAGLVIGWGPYEWADWKRGESITMKRYEDYVEPQPVAYISQKGTINDVTYLWRGEELVRMAMIQTGEADVAWAVSGDLADDLINSEHGNAVTIVSGEVYTVNVDTIWDPFMSQLKMRQAMTHAIDCESLALSFFGPDSKCRSGPNGIAGTLGVTEENAKPIYAYDPEKSRQLLDEIGYDDSHEIPFYTRAGRYVKDVEVSEALGIMWQEAGINVDIRVVEGGIWRERHLTGPGRVTAEVLKAGGTNEEAIAAVAGSDPPEPTFASPGLIFFAPGGELFDFGRQINFYISCFSNRSKNCDADREERANAALAAVGEDRRMKTEAIYEDFTRELLHIPLMDIVSVWPVNKDLDFVNHPGGRRILVNTMHWLK